MSRPSPRHLVAASLLAGSVLLSPGTGLGAQEESRPRDLAVGTYRPGEVVRVLGFQEKVRERFQGLHENMEEARQEGNQEAVRDIQSEVHRARQEARSDLLSRIEGVIPEVAETTGVLVVAVELEYTAPEVTTRDITREIVDALTARERPDDEESDDEAREEESEDEGPGNEDSETPTR